MEQTFSLDGREFRGVSESLSAAQDDYLLAHLRRSGAGEVLGNMGEDEESSRKSAEQLLTQIMISGEKFHILAGCLTESGKKWSRVEADRNAAIFAEITDSHEKLRMQAAIVRLVADFFALGAKSSATSQKSSNPNAEDRPIESADPGISETSPRSSASSPATTQTASMG